MKTTMYLFLFSVLLLSACNTPDNSDKTPVNPKAKEQATTEEIEMPETDPEALEEVRSLTTTTTCDSGAETFTGTVKQMKGSDTFNLSNVNISWQGGSMTTSSDGIFSISFAAGASRSVTFYRNNKNLLVLNFCSITHLEEVVVYMESRINDYKVNRKLLGKTLVRPDNTPVNVNVLDRISNRNDTSDREDEGNYKVSKINKYIDVKYDFSYNGDSASIIIKSLNEIKDSAQVDLIMAVGVGDVGVYGEVGEEEDEEQGGN